MKNITSLVEEVYKPSEGQKPEEQEKSLEEQLARAINEVNEDTQTAQRQARILIFMKENGAVDEEQPLKTPEIYQSEEFSDLSKNQVYTGVENLEEIGAIEVVRGSTDRVFVHESIDELHWDFGDPEVLQKIKEEIKLLVEDCSSNQELLEKASETLGTEPNTKRLKQAVFWDDPEEDLFTSINYYDEVIQAFISDDEINLEEKKYGEMGWRGVANRLYIVPTLADAMG